MKLDNINSDNILKYLGDISTDDYLTVDAEEKNSHFFGNLMNANDDLRKLIPDDCQKLNIYPPNIPIIDFLIKNFDGNKDNIHLYDYGCGIPVLIHFLNYCGFKNVYGYDDWSQVRLELAEEFAINSKVGVDKFLNFEKIIELENDINENKITCISHIGYPILKKDFEEFSTLPNIKFIFSDYRFTPQPIEARNMGLLQFENKLIKVGNKLINNSDDYIKSLGFYPHTIYNGLLVVYEKR